MRAILLGAVVALGLLGHAADAAPPAWERAARLRCTGISRVACNLSGNPKCGSDESALVLDVDFGAGEVRFPRLHTAEAVHDRWHRSPAHGQDVTYLRLASDRLLELWTTDPARGWNALLLEGGSRRATFVGEIVRLRCRVAG